MPGHELMEWWYVAPGQRLVQGGKKEFIAERCVDSGPMDEDGEQNTGSTSECPNRPPRSSGIPGLWKLRRQLVLLDCQSRYLVDPGAMTSHGRDYCAVPTQLRRERPLQRPRGRTVLYQTAQRGGRTPAVSTSSPSWRRCHSYRQGASPDAAAPRRRVRDGPICVFTVAGGRVHGILLTCHRWTSRC